MSTIPVADGLDVSIDLTGNGLDDFVEGQLGCGAARLRITPLQTMGREVIPAAAEHR
jgi:hypothetical protein